MRRGVDRELLEACGTWVTIGRRKAQRFPIELDVRYRTLDRRSEGVMGTGKTINISSSGVLFSSQHKFPIATRLEVAMR